MHIIFDILYKWERSNEKEYGNQNTDILDIEGCLFLIDMMVIYLDYI